jgi:hypothetical protein
VSGEGRRDAPVSFADDALSNDSDRRSATSGGNHDHLMQAVLASQRDVRSALDPPAPERADTLR